MAHVEFNIADTIAHMAGVKASVHSKGLDIGVKAEANLAAHRKTGAAHIDIEVQDTDVVVSLVDEAALSIEFGHFSDNGEIDASVKYVRGLYPLTRAAYGY